MFVAMASASDRQVLRMIQWADDEESRKRKRYENEREDMNTMANLMNFREAPTFPLVVKKLLADILNDPGRILFTSSRSFLFGSSRSSPTFYNR